MEIRRATTEDIGQLTEIRMQFIRESNGAALEVEREQLLLANLNRYFEAHINRDFFAELALVKGRVVAAVFLCILEKPANMSYPDGREGTVLNVYASPEYRKRGIATLLLDRIMEEADRQKLFSCELIATEMGRPLYEKFGFKQIHGTYMKRKPFSDNRAM